MGSERLIVVIQVLDYLKYSRGLNVSSLFSDFTYKSMELCHILVKDGLKWFAYCQRGQKYSHKIPRKLCLFSPWLSVGIAKEGRQKRQRLTCPLESPYRNPSRRFTFVLKKRRRVDQCRFAKYTSSNSDTFYRLRSTIALVIGSTITSSKMICSTQKGVYSIYIYTI